MVLRPTQDQGWTNMEYRLTEEDFASLKQCLKQGTAEFDQCYTQMVKERFNGSHDAMATEVYHRVTGKFLFNEKQTQRFN